jgi:hypothetical protein
MVRQGREGVEEIALVERFEVGRVAQKFIHDGIPR